jgi:predicted RNA polymerase sigma factor
VALNRAIAAAMAEGPEAGLAQLAELGEALEGNHRFHAARAHLLERAGDAAGAVREYEGAAALTRSLPERDYLTKRAAQLRAAT